MKKLGAVGVVGLVVLAVSVVFVEPKVVLFELSLEALERLLAVGGDVGNPNGLWLVEVVFAPDTLLEVEEDVPDTEKLFILFEGPLSVDGTAVPDVELVAVGDEGCATVPKVKLAVLEDEGCTAAVRVPAAGFRV